MFLWWSSDCCRMNNWLCLPAVTHFICWSGSQWLWRQHQRPSAMTLHKWLESSETNCTITAVITLLFFALRALSDCARLRIVTFQTASLFPVSQMFSFPQERVFRDGDQGVRIKPASDVGCLLGMHDTSVPYRLSPDNKNFFYVIVLLIYFF